MQDLSTFNFNERRLLGIFDGRTCFPKAFWRLLGRGDGNKYMPSHQSQFSDEDYVATGAECGCVLVRTLKTVKGLKLELDANGMYKCNVCAKNGGGNPHEREMLNKVKDVVACRKERIIVCCQVPLVGVDASLRCDVVLVPCAAGVVSDLIAVELDSFDHELNPHRYGRDLSTAASAVAVSDARKADAVAKAGMRFLRVKKSDRDDSWIPELNCMLDSLALNSM